MTQEELFQALKTIGMPVAYHHFTAAPYTPEPPEPPYIVYLRAFDNNISSDTKVHGKFKTYQIELYTLKKDLIAEQKVEELISKIDPDYGTSETYIESEGLYQVIYTIKTIERR